MTLDIITPKQIYFSGQVDMVILPGSLGSFSILDKHAPMISSLTTGLIVYMIGDQETVLKIESGFVEVKMNQVTVCVEEVQ